MARIRNIKPEFFLNEDLAELSAEARLAFIGLWTMADHEGRMDDRPKRTRLVLFPYHPRIDMESILSSLASSNFITRYVVNGEKYIQIRNFKKHQYISGKEKEKPSTIPGPDKNDTGTIPVSTRSSDTTLHSTDKGQLTTDNGQGTTDKGQLTTHKKSAPVGAEFEAFWNAYPRRVKKAEAEKAWAKVRPVLSVVLGALEWQRHMDDWTRDSGKFIPYPASYINGKRWEDEQPTYSRDDPRWLPTAEYLNETFPELYPRPEPKP